jgi:hypothetical protein
LEDARSSVSSAAEFGVRAMLAPYPVCGMYRSTGRPTRG